MTDIDRKQLRELCDEALRDGYRLSVSSADLAALLDEIEAKDARITELEGQLEEVRSAGIPKQYRYLKYAPKTPSDAGWNARVLGAEEHTCPYDTPHERWQWVEAFRECGAYLSQEIG